MKFNITANTPDREGVPIDPDRGAQILLFREEPLSLPHVVLGHRLVQALDKAAPGWTSFTLVVTREG